MESSGVVGLKKILETLVQDPILTDVPKNATLGDIEALISVELGSAMKLSLLKLDNTSFEVAVPNTASVYDLKRVIQRRVHDALQARMGHRKISWRYVWRNYCLSFGSQKLLDDRAPLQEFGIKNNSQIHFMPYIASREAKKHSRAKKRRFFHGIHKKYADLE